MNLVKHRVGFSDTTPRLCRASQISLAMLLILSLSACIRGGSSGNDNVVTTNETTPVTPADDFIEIPINNDDPEVDTTVSNEFPPVYRTPAGVTSCSADDIKQRVDFDMRDYYIYYDQVPQLNLADYDTPENLIKALRVDPDKYSFVADAVTQNAFVISGVSGGFGYVLGRTQTGSVRVKDIKIGSPADDAGMLRGDEVVLVNGIPYDDLTTEEFEFYFDPENAPLNLSIRTLSEPLRDVSIDFADYTQRTAGPARSFSGNGLATVGYLPISRFLESTSEEIDRSMAFLRSDGGIDELIVDLRYNTGGRIGTAAYIAALVGGAAVENEVFLKISENDKYAENNFDYTFPAVDQPLNLSRVFVLVTESTASSSEIFINSLEPFIDVIVIGGVTRGKPFLSKSREYCDKNINAMSAIQTNSVGVSVAGGIQPDCSIQDQWNTTAYSLDDPLFGGAINMIDQGTCPQNIQAFAWSPSPHDAQGFYSDPETFVSQY